MQKKESSAIHILYADFIRIYSITAIVILHVATRVVQSYATADSLEWWAANIIDSASRWGVPCFFMLSGSLLLESHKVEPARTFFRKRINRIAIPMVFWFLIYFFWLYLWYGRSVDLSFILNALIYWGPFYHLYFFYIIIPTYLITPLLRACIRAGRDSLVRVAVAGTVFLFIGVVDSVVFYFKNLKRFSLAVPLNTQVSILIIGYFGYFIWGYILSKIVISHRALHIILIAYVSAFMVIALGTYYLMKRFGENILGLYLYDYFSPPCLIMSFCIFLMIKGRYGSQDSENQSKKIYKWVSQVFSPATFGIFLVHPIFLDILEKFFPVAVTKSSYGIYITQWIRIPFLTVTIIFLSLITTVFIRKIPYIRRVVG